MGMDEIDETWSFAVVDCLEDSSEGDPDEQDNEENSKVDDDVCCKDFEIYCNEAEWERLRRRHRPRQPDGRPKLWMLVAWLLLLWALCLAALRL